MKTIRSIALAAIGASIAACSAAPDASVAPVGATRAAATAPTGPVASTEVSKPRVRAIVNAAGKTEHFRDCGDKADGHGHCAVLATSDESGVVTGTSTPASGWGATDLQSAYNVMLSGGAGKTVALIDFYDNPDAEADLGVYRAQYGLPACTTANGCFKKVNENGATSPLPAAAGTSNNDALETDLDVQMVSAACPWCNILLVEMNSTGWSDFTTAEASAVRAGATFVSASLQWGEWSGETGYESIFNQAGVSFFASGGDGSYLDVGYPSASAYVTSVGGTVLSTDSGARGWSETAWSGTGSGCSAYISKPSWQTDTGCSTRTQNDVSAVASGVAVYDSYSAGGWTTVAGTSIAAPLTAAIYAATGNNGATPQLSYTDPVAFNDVTSGSNGTCSPAYLCTAEAGYDAPTGNGTPRGGVLQRNDTFFADATGDRRADGIAVNSANIWEISSTGSGFTAPALWLNGAFHGDRATLFGDIDGDGRVDGVAYDISSVWVALSSGNGFDGPAKWLSGAFYGSYANLLADVNGDGKADGIAVNTGNIYVMLSTGSSFAAPSVWLNGSFYGTHATLAGDVNGDGKADGIAVNSGSIYVTLSSGSGFGAPALWLNGDFYGTFATDVGDVNGDGRADGVAFNENSIYVALSNGSGFGAPQEWLSGSFYGQHATLLADVNGDGKADGVAVNDGNIYVALSTGSGFSAPALWENGAFYGAE